MRFLLPLFFALSAMGQCVNFIDNPAYCRPATRWFIAADTNDWPLYLNGVDQNSPDHGGTSSIDFLDWPTKRTVTVGISDSDHGIAMENIITNVCPSATTIHFSGDAGGILSCLTNGAEVVVVPWNTALQGQVTDDLSNACWQCSQSNVILVCSVPNANLNIDSSVSYPGSWNLPLSIPVTSSTRIDTVFNPAAVGTNVIAAPSRVIVTQAPDGTPAYGSGTSYATAIVGGVVAFLLGQFQQTPDTIVRAIRSGSSPIDSRIVGRVSMAGAVNSLRPKIRISVDGMNGAVYVVEQSPDTIHWNYLTNLSVNSSCLVAPGFYRAKLL